MMDEEASLSNARNKEKISKALQKFLEPDFKVKNDVYLTLFLTHLVGKSGDKDSGTKATIRQEQKEQFCSWLIEASFLWNEKKVSPPNAILSFTLNLSGHLSGDEQLFVNLNCKNIYEHLVGIAHINLNKHPTVTVGLVNLLSSFLDHKSGVQWILANAYWNDVVGLGRDAHTLYIRKKSHEFIAKLLEKTICFNRTFCCKLISQLIKPLKDSLNGLPVSENGEPTFIENRTLFESLQPDLVFISEVLDISLKNTQRDVLNLFLELQTAEFAQKLLLLSQIEDFSFELIKIRCSLLFSKFTHSNSSKQGIVNLVAQDSQTLSDIKTLFDVIQDEMEKNHVKCVIKICHHAHALYSALSGNLPLCIRKGEPIEFQNQMLLFQIMPILIFFGKKRNLKLDELLNDVFRREFVQKLVKMSAIRSLEICFRWKERLAQKPDLIDDMTLGLQYMIKSKKFLNREQAAIFFQPLVYFLKDMLLILQKVDNHFESCKNFDSGANFLYTLIETLIDLVQSFDLTWKDCIETISVLSIACEYLQYNHWNQKLSISGLRLLNLALSKYMSPDMVLLMDNSQDSVVSQTGSLLYAKCHDGSWEVRDTALENVHTLSLNANSKFPSYTNVLLDAELPQLVFQMALLDGEFYVRATAFRCMQELIQIQQVWNIFMKNDKFLDSVLEVFENETEGLVRKEAATLMHKICEFQSFPEEMLPRVYDVMTQAAIGDLHWEVKCQALDFWRDVIKIHLSNQGMIDYAFPAVTFSKEHRKIVTLNEEEVRKRIIKVLNQLSRIGALYVLKCACLDDCDVEVSKKATETILKFVKILKTYKVPCENVDFMEPPNYNVPTPSSSLDTSCEDPNLPNSELLSPFPIPSCPSLNADLFLSPPASSPDSYQPFLSINSPTSSKDSSICDDSKKSSHTEGLPTKSNEDLNDDNSQSKIMEIDTKFNATQVELVLEDLLNSTDMAFLQRIFNPSDQQVKSTTSKVKKSNYLAPSEFLKFVYHEAETYSVKKKKWIDSLDEFDSLLDDILKEYDVRPDVNSMDCY